MTAAEQLEQAAERYANELRVSTAIPGALVPMLHDIALTSYICGAKDALTSQWISVKERLPELRERVLICERVGNQYKIFIGKRVPSPCPDGWGWNQSTKESVVAWMPLPQYQSEIATEADACKSEYGNRRNI